MLRRLSLRTRLVLGLLVLAAAGLVIADVATYKSQESFLFDQTDQTLQAEHQFAEGGPGRGGRRGPRLPPGTYVEARSLATGRVLWHDQGQLPRRGSGVAPTASVDHLAARGERGSAGCRPLLHGAGAERRRPLPRARVDRTRPAR